MRENERTRVQRLRKEYNEEESYEQGHGPEKGQNTAGQVLLGHSESSTIPHLDGHRTKETNCLRLRGRENDKNNQHSTKGKIHRRIGEAKNPGPRQYKSIQYKIHDFFQHHQNVMDAREIWCSEKS